jgi:hypothetical protein
MGQVNRRSDEGAVMNGALTWTTLIDSLQGVQQPQPSHNVKKAHGVLSKQIEHGKQERKKQMAQLMSRCEEQVYAALKIRGKISTCDIRSLGLDITEASFKAALNRLRQKGLVRCVNTKPYWECTK